MTTNQPRITLIIAVYNRADFLDLIFESLARQTFGDFEVIVADDGSGKKMGACIERHRRGAGVAVRRAWHEDDGFRKTIIVNAAAVMAQGEYLVFIDGDCVLHRRFLERHWNNRGARVVCSGRRVYFGPQLTARLSIDDVRRGRIERPSYWWRGAERHRLRGLYLPWLDALKNAFRSRYSILGSNFSLHKRDFLAVNGYDERIIGRGLEDNNLHVRVLKAGMRVRYVAHEAIQYHLHHPADPIPHTPEAAARFLHPENERTAYGIIKTDNESR